MKRIFVLLVGVSLVVPVFAVGKGKAKYMGGSSPGVKDGTEGPIDLKDAGSLYWQADNGNEGRISFAWSAVTEMEYGQKVSRRWRSAILLSPLALFSKARKHFMTIAYKDALNKEQAVVFEFDKDGIRQAMAILKARTGKQIAMQDEEAEKQMGGAGKK